jgi:DNA protecting protein DprA
MKINELSPQNNKYASVLSNIALMPKKLYVRGALPENRVPSVAIVGSRKPTSYGEDIGYKMAYDLARSGVVVISGLALGLDALAHRGALDAEGLTIAVLGNGVDDITPRTNRNLGERILNSGGAIISEYKPGVAAQPHHFLARNRIVSGLADAVVVIEAATRSGTLSTASYALEQGRHVFAVPGNIDNPMSMGCNALIKQGATPLTSFEDVLEVIAPDKLGQAPTEILGDNEIEDGIIKSIRNGKRDGEEICEELRLQPSEFGQAITIMEIKGQVRALGANKWGLKR